MFKYLTPGKKVIQKKINDYFHNQPLNKCKQATCLVNLNFIKSGFADLRWKIRQRPIIAAGKGTDEIAFQI